MAEKKLMYDLLTELMSVAVDIRNQFDEEIKQLAGLVKSNQARLDAVGEIRLPQMMGEMTKMENRLTLLEEALTSEAEGNAWMLKLTDLPEDVIRLEKRMSGLERFSVNDLDEINNRLDALEKKRQ